MKGVCGIIFKVSLKLGQHGASSDVAKSWLIETQILGILPTFRLSSVGITSRISTVTLLPYSKQIQNAHRLPRPKQKTAEQFKY